MPVAMHQSLTFGEFIKQHEQQLMLSDVPKLLWEILFTKLTEQIYDAGERFQILCEEQEDEDGDVIGHSWKVVVISEDGCKASDPNNIYLIDHAWTYQIPEARKYLINVPGLLERMCNLMEIEKENRDKEDVIEDILKEMWKYNQTFSFGHEEKGSQQSLPYWYIMDEFGSRIQHSDTPSFKTIPFYFCPHKLSYTLLWPLMDCEKGDQVSRNYVEGISNPFTRKAKLLPWLPNDMTDINCKQEEPDDSYFMSHRLTENFPRPNYIQPGLSKDRCISVFMEYKYLSEHLTDPRFQLVDDMSKADILWLNTHFKDFQGLSEELPGVYINQFPCEFILTVKDVMAVVSRRAAKADDNPLIPGPKWLPVTYNLKTELDKFASYYQQREKLGLDNHWICKPWNLARSMDMHITNDLNYIIRLADSLPKVACKYIHDPVLFYREDIGQVKFDFRYIVLLASVKPLKLYAYQLFWLRFANRPFSMDKFDEYEKHYTVMNYDDGAPLKQIHYDEFIPMFDEQYPAYSWSEIEKDVFKMIKELFEAASSPDPPKGIPSSPQSRSMYALDMMLSWETNEKGERYIQPMLCEVNFSPDCDRACKYHPFFINDCFSALFLDETNDKHVVLL